MSSRDLLHIPTPWHNCVAKMAGSEVLYVTKAKVVRQWPGELDVRGYDDDDDGAVYYSLRDGHVCGAEGDKREGAAKKEELAVLSRDGISSLVVRSYSLSIVYRLPIKMLVIGGR